jgi:putative hydrolase of the HAD superfamily
MSYRGLILDFGGVVTTDLYAEMSAFCVWEGLAHDAVVRVLRDTAEGREAIKAVEAE